MTPDPFKCEKPFLVGQPGLIHFDFFQRLDVAEKDERSRR